MGVKVTGSTVVAKVPPTTWRVAGFGDFNGDGHEDILFQDKTTGRIAVTVYERRHVCWACGVASSARGQL